MRFLNLRLMVRVTLLILTLSTYSLAQTTWKDIYSEGNWAERDKWQRAEEIIRLLDAERTDTIADIGCHEGYFTLKLASTVSGGIVYGVDISRKRIERVTEIAKERGFYNVVPMLAAADDPGLPGNSLDAVLIVDTYHEIAKPQPFLQNVKRAMKPGARLVICEPIADERKGATRQAQFKKHELESHFAVADLKAAGFEIIFIQNEFIDRKREKGDIMWILVAQKY